MCGIAGIWWPGARRRADAQSAVASMTAALRHRGPDAHGHWIDEDPGIALGHTRLSILDLSPAGAQPMTAASGRYVLVYNGEIYNHLEIRASLDERRQAPAWRGVSDTETLLALIEARGVAAALPEIQGMFAFAVWDRTERTLTLARDRIGEKPLYYGWNQGALIFGSELKSLMAVPGARFTLDPKAVSAYLRFSYVPDSLSIFQNIRKLAPGSVARFRAPSDIPTLTQYWRLEDALEKGRLDPLVGDSGELRRQTETCLRQVVQSQMMSDVPLGCFLSGGIDSSLIAALMQSSSARQVRTFSIGFESERFSEAHHARRTADHLGTDHTEFTVTESEALAVIADLPDIYDEPFADSSQIPTVLLSRLTRQEVTVALSGDGGDELFGGYNRYVYGPALWQVGTMLASPGRRLAASGSAALQSFSVGREGLLYRTAIGLGLPVTAMDRLAKFGHALGRAESFSDLYLQLVSTFPDPSDVLAGHHQSSCPLCLARFQKETPGREEWMMAQDATSYLPGDILVKVDRAAMSASLETRAPFLDLRVIELAARLPIQQKIDGRRGKRILRDLLEAYVPRVCWERPKQGFAIPIDQWLRGKLRDWATDLLSAENLDATGLFDAGKVAALWDDHVAERDNKGAQLWTVLMMQSWLLKHRRTLDLAKL